MFTFLIKKKYFFQVDDEPTPDLKDPLAPEGPSILELSMQGIMSGRITVHFDIPDMKMQVNLRFRKV